MNEHRYILEPYKGMSTRYQCPVCKNGKNTFTRYINTFTREYLDNRVGRCNRETKCGFHYTPKQFFQENPEIIQNLTNSYNHKMKTKRFKKPQSKVFSTIPTILLRDSLKAYDSNNFVNFLNNRFGPENSSKLISKYFIGSSKHWTGANVFWQIDISGNIRTGKIMLYNQVTGKRVKDPYSHINWVHKILKLPDFELNQCLFGEHLLKDN
jgi:hypothetical protein